MKDNIENLGKLFKKIVANSNEFGCQWKNIPLAREAFLLMRDELPLRVKGELTPYTRIVLLNNMLDCLNERDCPRFVLSVRDYQASLFPLIGDEDWAEDMDIDGYEGPQESYVRTFTPQMLETSTQRMRDYIDTSVTMDQWRERYDVHLRFDDVERSEAWERVIYDVEKECDSQLRGTPRGMGFCFEYWSTKRAILAAHGITWRSPSLMNPRVMFD